MTAKQIQPTVDVEDYLEPSSQYVIMSETSSLQAGGEEYSYVGKRCEVIQG